MPTLGEKLKSLRIKKGMTQEQLAQKLNTTKAAISRYERDQRQPRLEQITEIAQILDASPTELYNLFWGNTEQPDAIDEQRDIAFLNALFKPSQCCLPGNTVQNCDEASEDDIDEENSPFALNYLSEDQVVKKLLDIFLKLDREWQQNVIEDAEMYLGWQDERRKKLQKLRQDVE